ncbi:hypothetical protein [Olsenella sp. kh2p3]|uniref:hypothetical protein n=1 Tax=Olsenella sp. kh2p3 TaxID=1797112 RepID=UPI0011613749|nr:hypothetical protein [Olsenella sp. kh2p3]
MAVVDESSLALLALDSLAPASEPVGLPVSPVVNVASFWLDAPVSVVEELVLVEASAAAVLSANAPTGKHSANTSPTIAIMKSAGT